MHESLERASGFGRDVVDVIKEENVTFLAGSIAYNAFVSLLPLLLLLIVVGTIVGSARLQASVVDIAAQVAPSLEGLIENQLLAGGATSVSLVGGVTLLWGSLKLFRGLDTAFSEVYGTDDENGFVEQVTDGLVVLVAIVAAIAVTILATVALSVLTFVPYIQYLDSGLLLVGLVLAFLPMYYVFPDADVTVREVVPGVVVAAVGWTALQGLFQVYLELSGKSGDIGVFTGVLVLITWLYFSGLVLLVGAAVNAVRGGHAQQAIVDDISLDDDLDQDAVGAYLESLGEAFAASGREDLSGVRVADPDRIELEADEFVFDRGDESSQQVTVRWWNQGPRSDPTDD